MAGFTIPNFADATNAPQSAPDSGDFAALAAGYGWTGVVSGCAVTAQTIPDLTVAVAAGTVVSGGASAAVTAGNVVITTPSLTLPRFDIIVVSSAGVKSAIAGVPAAAPAFPATPAGSILLATVFVRSLSVSVIASDITDKRILLLLPGEIVAPIVRTADFSISTNGSFQDLTGMSLTFATPVGRAVLLDVSGYSAEHTVAQPIANPAALGIVETSSGNLVAASALDCATATKVTAIPRMRGRIAANTASKTYKVVVFAPNNGTLKLKADATFPMLFEAIVV